MYYPGTCTVFDPCVVSLLPCDRLAPVYNQTQLPRSIDDRQEGKRRHHQRNLHRHVVAIDLSRNSAALSCVD